MLSPYLFAVYVNDVDCSRTGCHVILYADDRPILLIAPTITQLEGSVHDLMLPAQKLLVFSLYGQPLSWAKGIKYLAIYLVSFTLMKCNLSHAKSCFYRGANEIFGKIGRFASVDVILELVQSKCIPALLLLLCRYFFWVLACLHIQAPFRFLFAG